MSGDLFLKSGLRIRLGVALTSFLVLSACAEGQMPGFLQPKSGDGETVARASGPGLQTTTERDVEAPDVFHATEAGLWDGRPSLGGIWVAHPDVTDPERAIIRNQQNGKFVIGALFRRERETPGPRLQISSDAAAALGLLAGQPTNLDVVALRREEIAAQAPANRAAPLDEAVVPSAPEVAAQPLDPVVESATKALETAALAPAAKPRKPARSSLSKPFLQIGIFGVEQNAKNTAVAMRQAGMVPTVKPFTSKGKPFWRVVVGPAQNSDERATLLAKIKRTGFTDAYPVTD